MNTTIDARDFNAIDYQNGSGNVSSKYTTIYGAGLKGALAKNNGTFSQYDEIIFVNDMRRKMYEYQTERFEYDGLPDPLTKYRFERKLINSGSALMVKIGKMFVMLNYTTIKTNIYDEPRIVRVIEPKSKLNGKQFDLKKDLNVMLIRNNEDMVNLFIPAKRFINIMEKCLYQLEKNITASAPKGILNLKGTELAFAEDGENPEKESMEKIINGEDTFYILKSKALKEQKYGENEDDLFIPIELADQTEKLLKNYFFAKEQIKEIIGAMINSTSQKKERNVVDEVNEQALANSARQHAFNIRRTDIENANKRFNLNISIDYQSDEREDDEDEEKGSDEDE